MTLTTFPFFVLELARADADRGTMNAEGATPLEQQLARAQVEAERRAQRTLGQSASRPATR